MTQLMKISTTAAIVVLALTASSIGQQAKKSPSMPISKVWRPGYVIGKQPQTRVPRGGPGTGKIDLNSCTLEQLQNLPGVGAAMAAHIMAGRPYQNFDDLARDGVPLSTINQIRPLVKVGP
jgi:DNA uptake protein ComE-like DNA-binding protein